jgi:hypothetical protein
MCIRSRLRGPVHRMNKPFLRARQGGSGGLYIPMAWFIMPHLQEFSQVTGPLSSPWRHRETPLRRALRNDSPTHARQRSRGCAAHRKGRGQLIRRSRADLAGSPSTSSPLAGRDCGAHTPTLIRPSSTLPILRPKPAEQGRARSRRARASRSLRASSPRP